MPTASPTISASTGVTADRLITEDKVKAPPTPTPTPISAVTSGSPAASRDPRVRASTRPATSRPMSSAGPARFGMRGTRVELGYTRRVAPVASAASALLCRIASSACAGTESTCSVSWKVNRATSRLSDTRTLGRIVPSATNGVRPPSCSETIATACSGGSCASASIPSNSRWATYSLSPTSFTTCAMAEAFAWSSTWSPSLTAKTMNA